MFSDGTKIGYSLQLDVNQSSGLKDYPNGMNELFRVLVEPGGVGLVLPEQIDRSLQTVGYVVDALKWNNIANDINYICQQVFPENPAVLSDWFGGVWLGASLSKGYNQFKIYLNLRWGDSRSRWQRVANVFSAYAEESLESTFLSIFNKTLESGGTPTGLALVISKGRLLGFRIYVGLHHPTAVSVTRLIPSQVNCTASYFNDLLQSLNSRFQKFEDQSITISYDFLLENSVIKPAIHRFKIDVCCNTYVGIDGQGLDLWTSGHLETNQVSTLRGFQSILEEYFGGSDIDYISFGFKSDSTIQHTFYVKPYGLSLHS